LRSVLRSSGIWLGLGLLVGILDGVLLRWLWSQGHFDKYLWFLRQALAAALPWHRLADFSPGYLAFLLVSAPLTHGGWWQVEALQLLALSLCIGWWGQALARLDRPLVGACAAGLLWLSKPVAVYASELEPEVLILLAHAAALALTVRAARDPLAARKQWWLLGGTWVACALLRPSALLGPLAAWLGAAASVRRQAPLRQAAGLAWLPLCAAAAIAMPAYLVLTGSPLAMSPGTVLYEGNHPAADGATAIYPWLVHGLSQSAGEPDPQHLAYRHLASLATGRPSSPTNSSIFWSALVLEWLRTEPRAAFDLMLEKLGYLWGPYEAHDLRTSYDRARSIGYFPPWSWAGVLPIALWGLWATRREQRSSIVALYLLGHGATLILFYASARQRVALWPALAWLGGLGIADMWGRLARWPRRRSVILSGILLVDLAIQNYWLPDSAGVRQQRYLWTVQIQEELAEEAARRALAAGRTQQAQEHLRNAWIWNPWLRDAWMDRGAPPERRRFLRAAWNAAQARLAASGNDPDVLFDSAALARRCGQTRSAESWLKELIAAGYRPLRPYRTPRTAYYEYALCAFARGDWPAGRLRLKDGLHQAPGDLQLLALALASAETPGPAAGFRSTLRLLHDPGSVRAALVLARLELGQLEAAERDLQAMLKLLPEWQRGREILRILTQRGRPLTRPSPPP
jgi:hypothetical protein